MLCDVEGYMRIGVFFSSKISLFFKKEIENFLEFFVGLVYQGKGIVFRFIIEYSSLRDFGP
jgi:hypothetical protein